MLAEKQGTQYSKTIQWIRCKLSFALLRTAVLCIRGCRSTSCASEAAGPRPVHQRLQVHVLCIRGCRSTSCASEAAGPRPVHQRLQVHVLCTRGCRSTSCASEAAGPRPVHQRLQVHILCIRGCRSTRKPHQQDTIALQMVEGSFQL